MQEPIQSTIIVIGILIILFVVYHYCNKLERWALTRLQHKQKVHVPDTFAEAVVTVINQLTEAQVTELKQAKHYSPVLRMVNGMKMRNDWNCWGADGNLNKWFRNHGIWHGDDKCACICKAVWLKANGKHIDIDREREFYDKHWKRYNLGFDGVKLSNDAPQSYENGVILVDKTGRLLNSDEPKY